MKRKVPERDIGKFNVDIKIWDDADQKIANIKRPLDKGIKEFDAILKDKLNITKRK